MGRSEKLAVRRSASGGGTPWVGRRTATTVLLAGAAAAGLGHARRASAANNVYVYTGPGGTATTPTTGDFNTSTNFTSTVGGIPSGAINTSSATELDFGGSGATGYTATNDVGSTTFNLNEIQLNSTSTATDFLAANASGNTFTFYNASGGTAPTILQNGTGAFNIGNGILQTNTLTIGGTGTGALTFTGTVGPTAASTATANIVVTYTGAPVTFAGTLNTNRYQAMNVGAGATVITKGTLNLRVNENTGSTAGTDVLGAGTIQLGSTTDSLTAPDIFFGPDHSGVSYYGARMTVASLNLGSSQRYIVSNSGHNSVGKYLTSTPNNDAYLSSNISGGGGITFQGNAYNVSNYAGLVLAGSDSFSGRVEVDLGSIYLDNAAALTQANQLTLVNNGTGYTHFFLLGNSTTVTNLTSSGTAPGNTGIANGNPLMNLAFGASTLTVNQTAATTFAGTINNLLSDGYNGTSYVPGNLSLTVTGTSAGALTLTGASTYTGPTAVNSGTLALGAGGSLANTSIGVASGATFAARPGLLSASIAGPLTLASGASFDMLDGSAGTFNASGSGTGLTLSGNTLGFDLAATGTDTVAVTNAAAVSGTNTVNVVASGNVQNGTYNLITAASGLGGTFQFANGTNTEQLTVNSILYTLTLNNSATVEQLMVVGATYDYWKGNLSNVWSAGSGTATNWTSDYAGTTGAPIPNANTNVIFTVQGGGANTNPTVLGQDFTIASLTFDADASQPVTISGANTLTINAGGISVNASSGSHTISTAALALGQTQVWTNNSGSSFTVNAPITGGSSNLTLAGTNTSATAYVLAGNNSYGATTINTGVGVTVGAGGTSGTLGTGAVVDNGTLTFNRTDVATVVAGGISGTGNLVQSGSGTTVVGGAVTTTGTTTVNNGTLQVASILVPSVANAVTVNSGTLQAGTITVPAVGGALNLNGSLVMTGTLTVTAAASGPTVGIGGGGTIYLQGTSTSAAAPDVYSYLPAGSGDDGNQINNNIVIGTGTHFIGGNSGNNSYGQYGTGDLAIYGSLYGTGGLVISGTPANSQFEVSFFNDNSNWTGPLTITQGEVALANGNTTGLTAANTVTFNPVFNTSSALYLFGNNVTIGSLSGTGAGAMYIRNGSLSNVVKFFQPSDAVLTVNQTTNGTFAGVISDGPNDYYSGTTATATTGAYNRLGLTLAASAGVTLNLTGSNTYTGPTTVQSGTLGLGTGATLGNTAITVGGGAAFAPAAGSTAGVTTVAGAGATLSVSGGTIDMTAGGTATTTGPFALHQSGSFGGTALSINGVTFDFAVSPTGADSIVVDGSASVSGTNIVNLTPLAGTYSANTYALISATSGLKGTFDFANNATTETLNGVTYTLVDTDGLLSLAINGGASVPLSAYYTGSLSNVLTAGGNGSATNFATDATGSTALTALPGATTNVFFTASGAQRLSTVLGANLSINSITFNGNAGGSVTVGGTNTLTLGAGGVTVSNNAPAPTISVASLVLGSDQSWTNNSGNPLTVSAPVSGGNLTIAGVGTTVLAGANSYGYTNVSTGATLQVGNAGAAGTFGTGVVTNAGTLVFNRTDNPTFANAIGGAGAVVQSGTGTTTLSGAVTTTGGVTVNTGALNVSGGLTSPGGLTVYSAALNVGGTVTSAGVVNVNGGQLTVGGSITTASGITLGSGSIAVSGSVTGTGGITQNGGQFTVAGSVSTPGAVNVNAGTLTVNGTLNLANANLATIASGAFIQSAGTLLLTNTSTATLTTEVAGAGTLQFKSTASSASAPDLQAFSGNSGGNYPIAVASTVDLGTTTRTFLLYTGQNDDVRYGGDLTVSGSIIGAGGIALTTPAATGYNTGGTLKLSGSNSFTGGVTIGDNTSLYVGSANALSAANSVAIPTTAANVARGNLFLYGQSATIGNLSGGSTAVVQNGSFSGESTTFVTAANATLTVTETGTTTYAGRMIDGLTDDGASNSALGYYQFGLVKAGAGTLTLSGSSTYSGGTTVSGGTLRVNNTAGSGTGTGSVIIASGATLGGSGRVGISGNASTGAVNVSGGATITAGADTLTTGNLSTGVQTWNSTGTFLAKVTANGTAVSGNDTLVMSGLTLNATAGTGNQFNVNVALAGAGTPTLASNQLLVLANDTDATAANPFNTSSNPTTLSALSLTVTGLTSGTTGFTLATQPDAASGFDLVLEDVGYSAAPEPASLLLAGAAAAPLMLGRRRRRARSA